MSQRLYLSPADFAKLVRDEMVNDGAFTIVLQGISDQQKLQAIADAMNLEHPLRLEDDKEDIRRWVHGINQSPPQSRASKEGGFLDAFAATVCRADSVNYVFLRPAILALMAKYPDYCFTGAL